jgi:hypothetical protein
MEALKITSNGLDMKQYENGEDSFLLDTYVTNNIMRYFSRQQRECKCKGKGVPVLNQALCHEEV